MTDITSGPLHVYGDLGNILNAPGQGQSSSVVVPDPNNDRGPNLLFMADALPDIRCFYGKDKVAGFVGVVPSYFSGALLSSVGQIPAQLATNNIAAAANPTQGTAMTLAGATTGITPNVPIIPFLGYGQMNNGAVVTTGLALDFGFAFGNVTALNTQIQVADSTQFAVGMPLVIGGVGNTGGTTCLLTTVASIVDATHITTNDVPQATNATAPIGTGNLWGPSEVASVITPTAALPYIARGPGLFMDPAQTVARGVQISAVNGGAAGGNILVSGYDVYGMAMSELITLGAGAVTAWGRKAFKYIVSVVPQYTDVQTIQVGTSDVFGYHFRSDTWDSTQNVCNGQTVGNSVGWTVADTTNPATSSTGDVRGTLQISDNGGGSSIAGGQASNGSIVALAMSGIRLSMSQNIATSNILRGIVSDTRTMFGCTQS